MANKRIEELEKVTMLTEEDLFVVSQYETAMSADVADIGKAIIGDKTELVTPEKEDLIVAINQAYNHTSSTGGTYPPAGGVQYSELSNALKAMVDKSATLPKISYGLELPTTGSEGDIFILI